MDEPKRPKRHGAIPVIAQLKLLLDLADTNVGLYLRVTSAKYQ